MFLLIHRITIQKFLTATDMGTYTLKTILGLGLAAKAQNVVQDDLLQIRCECTSRYFFFFVATTLFDIHSILLKHAIGSWSLRYTWCVYAILINFDLTNEKINDSTIQWMFEQLLFRLQSCVFDAFSILKGLSSI